MHGLGEYIYHNESKIIGKWKKGVLEGKGDVHLPPSTNALSPPYHGVCKDNLFQDKGNPSIEVHNVPAIQLDGW